MAGPFFQLLANSTLWIAGGEPELAITSGEDIAFADTEDCGYTLLWTSRARPDRYHDGPAISFFIAQSQSVGERHCSRATRDPSSRGNQLGQPGAKSKGSVDSYSSETQVFGRFLARAAANTVGPLAVVGVYLFIVFEYLQREEENGVIPNRVISANGIFFAWIILSIFLLEWARSALAGFEAAALMKPRLAPASALQLIWHTDREWGTIGGWYKAAIYSLQTLTGKATHHGYVGVQSTRKRNGPVGLWWLLSASSFLFYAAVPLSGLSMNPADSLELSPHTVQIQGANETTFGLRANSEVANAAMSGWRRGEAATPQAPSVFYVPEDIQNTTDLYYDNAIHSIYLADLTGNLTASRNVTFFSGPQVSERVHGTAWGLSTTIGCTPVSVYTGLELMNISSYSNWSIPGLRASNFNGSGLYTGGSSYSMYGSSPGVYFQDIGFGVNFTYLIASDHDIIGLGNPDYNNASNLPINGSFEIALWQNTLPNYPPDASLLALTNNPLATSSENQTGIAVRCTVSTDVGTASLSPSTHTFSHFTRQPANFTPGLTATYGANVPLFEYAGGYALQTVVLSALTGIVPGYIGAPSCLPNSISGATDSTCNVFYSANLATGGRPLLQTADTGALLMRQPTLTPARLTLAMYKIVGESAASMMAVGAGNWTGSLHGLRPASDLQAGIVPWQVVVVVLGLWAVLTVGPQLWVLGERRWAATLTGEEMVRFGLQLGRAGREDLKDAPGLVGDLRPGEAVGEIGLSQYRARRRREYVVTSLEG